MVSRPTKATRLERRGWTLEQAAMSMLIYNTIIMEGMSWDQDDIW